MKSFTKLLAGALFISLLAGCAAESPMPKGDKIEKVKKEIKKHNLEVVDYDYVLSKIGKGTRKGAKALILDARPAKKYAGGHIPSARVLTDTKYEQMKSVVAKTPKDAEIITYCQGFKCEKSVLLAIELQKDGFTNVKVYWAGFPDWKKKNYYEVDNALAYAKYKKDAALFIDARPAKKFKQSTIVGSLSVPDTKFDKYKGRLPVDKNQEVITFCGGYKCDKSHIVAKHMKKMGYKNVTVLASGMPTWKKAGYPVTGGGAKAKKAEAPKPKKVNKNGVLKFGVDEGSVDGEWFKKTAMAGKLPKEVVVVDVRDAEDYNKGHIPGAINLVATLKPKEFEAKLPKGKEVVFYCYTGAKSMDVWSGFKDVLKYPQGKMDKILYFDANVECSGVGKCEIEVNEPLGD